MRTEPLPGSHMSHLSTAFIFSGATFCLMATTCKGLARSVDNQCEAIAHIQQMSMCWLRHGIHRGPCSRLALFGNMLP